MTHKSPVQGFRYNNNIISWSQPTNQWTSITTPSWPVCLFDKCEQSNGTSTAAYRQEGHTEGDLDNMQTMMLSIAENEQRFSHRTCTGYLLAFTHPVWSHWRFWWCGNLQISKTALIHKTHKHSLVYFLNFIFMRRWKTNPAKNKVLTINKYVNFTAGKNNEWYKTHIRSLIAILVYGCVQNNHLKIKHISAHNILFLQDTIMTQWTIENLRVGIHLLVNRLTISELQ